MELRTCEYCGMEFSKEHTVCPLCGRPVQPESTEEQAPIYNPKKPAAGRRVKPGRFAARSAARKAVSAAVVQPPKAQRAEEAAETESSEKPVREKAKKENVYAIPHWMMVTICVMLGVAVISGALFAFYNIGYFDSILAARTPSVQQETVSAAPAEPEQPVASAAQYTNEEDYKTEEDPAQPEIKQIACTGLTLGTSSITFDEAEQFYNITATVTPAGCTDEVVYTSSDERIVTVNAQGKIVAVSGGVAEVTATCGEYTQTCLVTCDFLTPQEQEAQAQAPTLSSTDMTFTYPGQQATLLVSNVEEGTEVAFESTDSSVASVDAGGVITAVGSGTTTVTVTVGEERLECIVRCNLDDSAESGGSADAGVYTISNEDVTMTIVGEYFKLTLKDADGKRVTGVVWTSSDTSVCTVDADGVVYAVGRGTTTVYTTYGGKSYECIVRCPIS